MTPETLEALKECSITRWYPLAFEKLVDCDELPGCQLCAIHKKFTDPCSMNCPVKAKTGQNLCQATPFARWLQHYITNS